MSSRKAVASSLSSSRYRGSFTTFCHKSPLEYPSGHYSRSTVETLSCSATVSRHAAYHPVSVFLSCSSEARRLTGALPDFSGYYFSFVKPNSQPTFSERVGEFARDRLIHTVDAKENIKVGRYHRSWLSRAAHCLRKHAVANTLALVFNSKYRSVRSPQVLTIIYS